LTNLVLKGVEAVVKNLGRKKRREGGEIVEGGNRRADSGVRGS